MNVTDFLYKCACEEAKLKTEPILILLALGNQMGFILGVFD